MAKPIPETEAKKVMIAAGLEPLTPFVDTKTKWKCRCTSCGREVFPTYSKVKKGYKGCLYCAGKKVDLDELAVLIQNLHLIPLHDYPGASTKWRMICSKCFEEFDSRYDYIKVGRGCPFCSGARILEKDAIRLMTEVGLEPLEVFKSSASPWKCRCKSCGKISKRTLHNVKSTGKGCPHCSFARTRVPQDEMNVIARELGFEPLEPYETQTKLWKLKCTQCGLETSRFPASLKFRKRSSKTGLSGCLGCVTRRKVTDSDQGATAAKVMELAGFEVLEPYVSAKHPWKVRCKKCKMEMTKQFTHVKSEQKGCKYCSGNYLNQEQIYAIMLDAQLEPLEPYINAQKPWKCKCLKCGRTVKPRFGGISAGIGGCKFCGPHGLDLNQPAFVYLITHPELNAHKIGVSGIDIQTDRLKAHMKYGWKLYKRLNVDTGEVAYLIEQDVLGWIRNEIGLSAYLLRELMPQGGYSETVDASEIDLPTIWAKVELLSRVKK
jgi:Zn finger protein HypA/HybF involved in hydrogenase expression